MLNEIVLTDTFTDPDYPDYDFYNISQQKADLIEKFQSDAFKQRYFKQYKNLTGNDMSEDEWNQRITDQISFTESVPDQVNPITWQNVGIDPDTDEYKFWDENTEGAKHRLGLVNPALFSKVLGESRGHVGWTLNKDTGEYEFDEMGLLGPREFQALERFYAPGGQDSFSHLYGEKGIHPYADIIKTHEMSHLYNSPQSPLWKGIEGYDAPAGDFYKNIFDQGSKYDEDFIGNQ